MARRETSLGAWSPRTTQWWLPRVFFVSHGSHTWSWKSPKPGNTHGAGKKICLPRLQRGKSWPGEERMEGPVFLPSSGRVNRGAISGILPVRVLSVQERKSILSLLAEMCKRVALPIASNTGWSGSLHLARGIHSMPLLANGGQRSDQRRLRSRRTVSPSTRQDTLQSTSGLTDTTRGRHYWAWPRCPLFLSYNDFDWHRVIIFQRISRGVAAVCTIRIQWKTFFRALVTSVTWEIFFSGLILKRTGLLPKNWLSLVKWTS